MIVIVCMAVIDTFNNDIATATTTAFRLLILIRGGCIVSVSVVIKRLFDMIDGETSWCSKAYESI